MRLKPHLSLALRWGARGLGTLAVWCVWLALAALLLAQLYVGSTRQLEVPGFVLRAFERRLAASGMHATFGRTRFDPSGRILIDDLSVTLPNFSEPLVTARAVFVRLDLWALSLDRFEPLELGVAGGSLRVPAMFSASGRPEEIVRDLDADLTPREADLGVDRLTFRFGRLQVAARGTVHLGALGSGSGAPLPLADFFARHYGTLSRKFADLEAGLDALDQPALEARFIPSQLHGADIDAVLVANGLHLDALRLEASGLRAAGRFPLLNSEPAPIQVRAEADRVRLGAGEAEVRGLQARLQIELPPNRMAAVWRSAEASAADLRLPEAGLDVATPLVRLRPGSASRLGFQAIGRPLGLPLAVSGQWDRRTRSGEAAFSGELSPALLDLAGTHIHGRFSGRLEPLDLKRYAILAEPVRVEGRVRMAPGGAFGGVEADIEARRLSLQFRPAAAAGFVAVDEASGHVEFDGRKLSATDAFIRIGQDYARGSYEEDVPSKRYRFLLRGRLRPMDTAPWFADWWPKFFTPFDFSASLPAADVDLSGQWPTDRQTAVFLSVDAAHPAYRGVAFDRARARLFVRPNIIDDGLEAEAERGGGRAAGTFLARLDADGRLVGLDLDLSSDLEYAPLERIWPERTSAVTAFAFQRPPRLLVRGHLDLPAAPGGAHQQLHIEAASDAPVRYHGFPLDRLSFTAEVRDEDISLHPLALGFAGGAATGRAEVSGQGASRRIRFQASLQNASLPQAIEALRQFSANGPPAGLPLSGDVLPSLAGDRFDLAASAEGAFDDPTSYQGGGKVNLRGPDLARVRLLGLLSEVLPFTALHFTQGRGDFAIDRSRLAFSDVELTGSNSRIQARGTYGLKSHALDFYARIFPLKQNKFVVTQLLSTVITPITYLSQIRLSGTLANPKWSLSPLAPEAGAPPAPASPAPLRSPDIP